MGKRGKRRSRVNHRWIRKDEEVLYFRRRYPECAKCRLLKTFFTATKTIYGPDGLIPLCEKHWMDFYEGEMAALMTDEHLEETLDIDGARTRNITFSEKGGVDDEPDLYRD